MVGRTITIELTDEAFQALAEAGQAMGETPGAVLRRLVQRERDLIVARRTTEAAATAAVEATIAARARRLNRTEAEARAEWVTTFPPLPALSPPIENDPYCGSLDIDEPRGVTNDLIDRDLAVEAAGDRVPEV